MSRSTSFEGVDSREGYGLVVDNLTMKYAAEPVVNDVSFTVAEGSITALLGPSGCGKTSTLRCIAGLEDPVGGSIWVSGNLVVDGSSRVATQKRNVNMVFQSYAVWPHLAVVDNVAYGLRIKGMSKRAARSRALDVLGSVGLGELADRAPSELSGGQQQRVAVARAVVTDPSLLLFDEPLSNLDAGLRVRMRRELVELQRRLGKTALYVTHDQAEAMSMADNVVLMNSGKIVQVGSPEELYFRPLSQFVARFMGPVNSLDCEIDERVSDDLVRVRVASGAAILASLAIASPSVLEKGCAVVRPEAIGFANGDEGENCIDGIVRDRMFLGSHSQYTVDTVLGDLLVTGDAKARRRVGDRVSLFADPTDVRLVGSG